MKWLIDLIAEKVIATIGIPPVFIDRGDPAAKDFVIGDLTTDDSLHTLDLSGIVPAGAKAVLLEVLITGEFLGKRILFRKKGNTNLHNVMLIRTQGAHVIIEMMGVVAVDAERKIEYKAHNIVWDAIDIVVCGWWL